MYCKRKSKRRVGRYLRQLNLEKLHVVFQLFLFDKLFGDESVRLRRRDRNSKRGRSGCGRGCPCGSGRTWASVDDLGPRRKTTSNDLRDKYWTKELGLITSFPILYSNPSGLSDTLSIGCFKQNKLPCSDSHPYLLLPLPQDVLPLSSSYRWED